MRAFRMHLDLMPPSRYRPRHASGAKEQITERILPSSNDRRLGRRICQIGKLYTETFYSAFRNFGVQKKAR